MVEKLSQGRYPTVFLWLPIRQVVHVVGDKCGGELGAQKSVECHHPNLGEARAQKAPEDLSIFQNIPGPHVDLGRMFNISRAGRAKACRPPTHLLSVSWRDEHHYGM